MKIILVLMLMFNSFMAGYIFASERGKFQKVIPVFLFGFPWCLYEVARAILAEAWQWIDGIFKIHFWWDYHVRKDIDKYVKRIESLDRDYERTVKSQGGLKAYFWRKGYFIIKAKADNK